MVKDRLLDLQVQAKLVKKPKETEKTFQDPLIPDFFQKVYLFPSIFTPQIEVLRSQVDHLEQQVNEIGRMYIDIIAAPLEDKNLTSRVDDLTAEIKTKANLIRSRLLDCEKDVFVDDAKGDEAQLLMGSNAKDRIKHYQFSTVSKRYASVMTQFLMKQNEFKTACKQQIRTNLKLAGRDYSEAQLDDVLESGQTHLFADQIISQTEAAKRMLYQIEARHQDLMKLERNITELKDIFVSINFLIQQQGETIDRIDVAVNNTTDYVDSAKDKLKGATETKKGIRRVSLAGFLGRKTSTSESSKGSFINHKYHEATRRFSSTVRGRQSQPRAAQSSQLDSVLSTLEAQSSETSKILKNMSIAATPARAKRRFSLQVKSAFT
ncbi:Syntaxin-1A [Cichlidogyrus casuarinus]|uniref:Syntaxin-1A n=1 Tax=Cichlidogyrus casuarinus TaxID=1844966 RepID=A0ABD2PW03_9PLAT